MAQLAKQRATESKKRGSTPAWLAMRERVALTLKLKAEQNSKRVHCY